MISANSEPALSADVDAVVVASHGQDEEPGRLRTRPADESLDAPIRQDQGRVPSRELAGGSVRTTVASTNGVRPARSSFARISRSVRDTADPPLR